MTFLFFKKRKNAQIRPLRRRDQARAGPPPIHSPHQGRDREDEPGSAGVLAARGQLGTTKRTPFFPQKTPMMFLSGLIL